MKDYLETIVKLDNIIDPIFIDRMIPLINHRAKKILETGWGVNKNIRNVIGHHLTFQNATDVFYFNYIKNEIERLYTFYKIKFPKMASHIINQIDLLKYDVGGNYITHIDHSTTTARHLSIIMNLNDDYEGGDLVFTDQKNNETKRLKLGKGSIVFFPSNFMYPHGIQSIKKGTRYSIVAWLQ